MRLENSELRAFRAVIEEGGFKRAADSLHISQSAVSQAVAGLESKLEVTLLNRGKELVLTDAGRRLFEHAVDVLRGDAGALKLTPLIASALDNPELRPSIQRLRDQFSTVWEVSSLSLRIHMVAQGMGVTFLDRKVLREHPSCRDFRIMDDLSFGTIDKEVGLYYRSGRILSDSARDFMGLCQQYWEAR
jgi:DNA-binding transcriptional LysR family regulator